MNNTLATFDYEQFYHVFNRTNNSEILYRNDDNKRYFLQLVNKRLQGFVKFYAYALLGNHFHFAISIKSEKEIENYIENAPLEDRSKTESDFLATKHADRNVHKLVAKQWSRVFNSYSQAINKRFNRKGHLFHAPFKRSLVHSESKLSFLIYYIHHNSRHHGLIDNFKLDLWQSYHELLANNETKLERECVLEWFGCREDFIAFHNGEHLTRDFLDL